MNTLAIMGVNNVGNSLGTNSRGYLKTTKFNTGSIRLLFICAVYFYILISSANGQLVDRIKYYDVTGRNTADFNANWQGKVAAQGFLGYCLWQPFMSHSYIQTSWGYKPSKLNLKVHVTLTLPRVKFPEDMPTATRYDYSQLIQKIYNHEYQHRRLKIEFYNQFVKEFNRLPAYRTIGEMNQATNKLLWKLYNNTKAKDAWFDRNSH